MTHVLLFLFFRSFFSLNCILMQMSRMEKQDKTMSLSLQLLLSMKPCLVCMQLCCFYLFIYFYFNGVLLKWGTLSWKNFWEFNRYSCHWNLDQHYNQPIPKNINVFRARLFKSRLMLKSTQGVYFSTPRCCSTLILGKSLH